MNDVHSVVSSSSPNEIARPFQTSGKVADVNVKTGDAVTQGQVLASLESDDLRNAVGSAQANLRTAQLRLNDLLAGSTDVEVATAFQAMEQARAALVKATNDYNDLLDGASVATISAAEQAVEAARAQLASAEATRNRLNDGVSAADKAAAEAAVASSEASLAAAQTSLANAANTLASAGAALNVAQNSYCAADNAPAFCTTFATPISGGDMALMTDALSGSNAALASGVISANGTYLSATNAQQSAQAAVASAQKALTAAQVKLASIDDGPSAEDVASADAAVAAAQAGLRSAEDKLREAREGATASTRETAAAAVASAQAAFDSAERRYEEALRGPKANAIDQAREAVVSAQLSVEAAEIRLRNAQIIAPFNGTVAAVNIVPGEFFGPANQEPAIVLLTPDRLQVLMDISETDYANVQTGQAGGMLFDAFPGRVFPFVIEEIGLSPTVNQGVVTYKVKAALIVGEGSRPSPGMNGRGQIITESRRDVLTVPPRAIRSRGREQLVDVKRAGGIEEVVITTGLSDDNNIEVTSGLEEGDIVVAPVLNVRAGEGPEAQPTLPGGIR